MCARIEANEIAGIRKKSVNSIEIARIHAKPDDFIKNLISSTKNIEIVVLPFCSVPWGPPPGKKCSHLATVGGKEKHNKNGRPGTKHT
jgi:hypothetical protein